MMQNSITINKNIDIARTKTLILSQLEDDNHKCFKELDSIEKMYQNLIYPEIKSDAVKYLEFANSLIKKSEALTKKHYKR